MAATQIDSNAAPVQAPQPGGFPISLPDRLAQSYAGAARLLKARWSDPPLPAAAAVGALEELAASRHGLAGLLPAALEDLPDRRAFWINVYNGAVVDRALAAGVRRSVKEQRRFFGRRQLCVAGVPLSLDDVEHGFLRGNRRHPARLLSSLWRRPRLRHWVVDPVDPRIHFALNCGGRSCPPLRHYTPAGIESELEMAAGAFIDGGVTVDAATSTITANPILRWYRADFAPWGGLDGLLRRYLTGGLGPGPWRYRWAPYDWDL